MAAEQGKTKAAIAFGGFRYYKAAVHFGSAEGQFRYGRLLENGRGVRVKVDKARRYYSQAAARGHEEARARLAGLSDGDL
jgi:TPR repeat protein